MGSIEASDADQSRSHSTLILGSKAAAAGMQAVHKRGRVRYYGAGLVPASVGTATGVLAQLLRVPVSTVTKENRIQLPSRGFTRCCSIVNL